MATIDNKQYWNSYYAKQHNEIKRQTQFADYVYNNWASDRKHLLEYGCGNGRDSLFFANQGLDVCAMDASETTISNLKELNSTCDFICDDFINPQGLNNRKFDICYSRFTIHAISLEDEVKLISNSYDILNDKGIFCIEVRSINDPLYGLGEPQGKDEYIYNDHYRRFLRINELIKRLIEVGFNIRYAEENSGFAPFKDNDPPIIRIVAEK